MCVFVSGRVCCIVFLWSLVVSWSLSRFNRTEKNTRIWLRVVCVGCVDPFA